MKMKMSYLALLALLLSPGAAAQEPPRKFVDDVGFCTKPGQIEKIVDLASMAEGRLLSETAHELAGRRVIAVISPHDDHLYAGRVYLHAIPAVAAARTVVIFGVTHHAARVKLKDPKNLILFDAHESWQAPYSPVAVDSKLRSFLAAKLPPAMVRTSNTAHDLEHSIEAMLPFLQYENRTLSILPLMVSECDFENLDKNSALLAAALYDYIKSRKLMLGRDISFVISTDTTHYGPDFDYAPFGLDAAAHLRGTDQDRAIGKRWLAGEISASKIKGFTAEVWGRGIPWCGKYSVPFGVLTVSRLAEKLGRKLIGIPLRYGDSYSLGVLPTGPIGLGTTAPFSLKHWVGYWGIAYTIE